MSPKKVDPLLQVVAIYKKKCGLAILINNTKRYPAHSDLNGPIKIIRRVRAKRSMTRYVGHGASGQPASRLVG